MKVSVATQSNLSARLNALPRAMNTRVKREALTAGAELIRAEAAALAPRDEQADAPHLADNIVIAPVPKRRVGEQETAVEVGPSGGSGGNDFFYGYLQEFGTAKAPAQSFMRPAFDTKAAPALQVILGRLWRAVATFSGFGSRAA